MIVNNISDNIYNYENITMNYNNISYIMIKNKKSYF